MLPPLGYLHWAILILRDLVLLQPQPEDLEALTSSTIASEKAALDLSIPHVLLEKNMCSNSTHEKEHERSHLRVIVPSFGRLG